MFLIDYSTFNTVSFLFFMTTSNSSTALIIYYRSNSSTIPSVQCTFDVGLFLRFTGTFIVIFGLIGNILSILVLSRKALRSRSCSLYLLALSFSDIWVLIGYTFENLLFHGYKIQLLSSIFMCKSIIFIIYASTDISNYLLTLTAVDRCVLVSYQTTPYFCRISTAKSLIVFVIVLFSLINSHFFFGFHIGQDGLCLPKPTKYIDFYFHHYDSYIDIIKTVLIPFSLIFISNIIIISRLTKRQNMLKSASRQSQRRRQEKERQLTSFLLLTSMLFIILSLPSEINDFLRSNLSQEFKIVHACELWIATTIFILLHQIHHASHFYAYTLTGPIFRKEFQKLICYH